jgi:hypothetical protein
LEKWQRRISNHWNFGPGNFPMIGKMGVRMAGLRRIGGRSDSTRTGGMDFFAGVSSGAMF